jgi:bifunctional DNA-binding transcriptional regulator/antitoxin component of YhaV-PrlF toxin-antitoxin module
MEKKFNTVVGEDGTVKLPDAVLEKLEVKPGEEVRFEVYDNFYAVSLILIADQETPIRRAISRIFS